MKASGLGGSKSQKKVVGEKKKGYYGHGTVDKNSSDIDSEQYLDTDNSDHHASLEIQKILNFNEGMDKMNEFATQLHQEFMDSSNIRPGAGTAFYDQIVSIENAHKYPAYLSHAPDSMFETQHIIFESPALNPGATGLVCRDPSPEDYAKFLAAAEEEEFNSGPSASFIDRHPSSQSATSTKVKKWVKVRVERSSAAVNDPEDEIQSVIHAPEIWKLLPDSTQNLKDMTSDIEERQSTRRIVNNYYPTKNAFTYSTKAQSFWVHLGIPMPSPPTPFLISTFLKLNNQHHQSPGMVTLESGVRRFCVGMNGFSSEELTFSVEGKKIVVTGTKLKDKRNSQGKRTATEGFTLPDDLHLHDLQVLRDDVGNVIFQEVWHEPPDTNRRFTVLNEEIPDFLLKD